MQTLLQLLEQCAESNTFDTGDPEKERCWINCSAYTRIHTKPIRRKSMTACSVCGMAVVLFSGTQKKGKYTR